MTRPRYPLDHGRDRHRVLVPFGRVVDVGDHTAMAACKKAFAAFRTRVDAATCDARPPAARHSVAEVGDRRLLLHDRVSVPVLGAVGASGLPLELDEDAAVRRADAELS